MGCVCAKGRPTLKVSMNKTTIREDSLNKNESIIYNSVSPNEFSNSNNNINSKSKLTLSKKKNSIKNNPSNVKLKKNKVNTIDCVSENMFSLPPDPNLLLLMKQNKTHKIKNPNNLIKALPSFNEFNNVTIEQISAGDGIQTNVCNNNANGHCCYLDYFTNKKVELNISKNGMSNRNKNKLSISNSSLSYDRTPSFSEDNSSNCKGIVNVTNITNININPIIVGNNISPQSTIPEKKIDKI